MSKTLTIGSETFEFPEQGTNPDWAEEVTDWATAVTDALQNVQAPNEILITSALINNNQSVPANIAGFSFNTSEVRSINAEYYIKRTTDVPAVNLVESGFIEGNFDGTDWTVSVRSNGTSEVDFDITPAGQLTYTSSNLTGSNYSGIIKFKSRVINET